jgi:GNAT superfamily N-acetyltransferase
MLDPLHELALRPWGRPQPGGVQLRTAERLIELYPAFPIPGPNRVCLLRCAPERVDPMVDEVRAVLAERGQRCAWLLDDRVAPADLEARLVARGMRCVEEVDAMALPLAAVSDVLEAAVRPGPGVEIVDGLRDAETYAAAEAVQEAAFGEPMPGSRRQRLANDVADPDRHVFLALADGRPAGAGWATRWRGGVLLTGGAVHPELRGRGVYRALVGARLRLARQTGAAGLVTSARQDTSAPILARLGFRTVGRWRRLDDGGSDA